MCPWTPSWDKGQGTRDKDKGKEPSKPLKIATSWEVMQVLLSPQSLKDSGFIGDMWDLTVAK